MVSPWLIATAMLAPPFALLYDHLLTLDLEIRHIWLRPKRRSAYWFFFLRYFVSLGEIVTLAFRFYTVDSVTTCNWFQTYINIHTLIVELLVAFLMSMRVYALYECSRRIMWFMIIVAGSLLPIVGWTVAMSSIGTVLLQGMMCGRFFPEKKAFYLTITWACALAYDTTIFILTIIKTYKTTRSFRGVQLRIPLLEVMLRDGVIYFGVMCCVHLANLILCATRSSSMSALARDISALMVSRLMLNLHEKASEGLLLTNNATSWTVTVNSGMVFNSNAEYEGNNPTDTAANDDQNGIILEEIS